MTFKNGAYLEYTEEKHRDQLCAKYGEHIIEIYEKLDEIITRINTQDGFLNEVSDWGVKVTDKINVLVKEINDIK